MEQAETAEGLLGDEGAQGGPPASQGGGLGQRLTGRDLSSVPAVSSSSLASVGLSTREAILGKEDL